MTQPRPNYPPPGYPYPYQPGYAPPAGYSVPPPAPGYFPRPVPTSPTGLPLADFGQRLAAYLLDALILGAVTAVPIVATMIGFFVLLFSTVDDRGPTPSAGLIFLIYAVFLVVTLGISFGAHYLYDVTYQVRKGQTIGKRIMKIMVVNLDNGQPIGVVAARRRWLVRVGCSLVGPLSYLDGLWQLWDQPYRQCLHDKWPRTAVVKVDRYLPRVAPVDDAGWTP